jgi:hypothetical protein
MALRPRSMAANPEPNVAFYDLFSWGWMMAPMIFGTKILNPHSHTQLTISMPFWMYFKHIVTMRKASEVD